MGGSSGLIRRCILVLLGVAMILSHVYCTRSEIHGGVRSEAQRQQEPPPQPDNVEGDGVRMDTVAVYDLEEEMLEEDEVLSSDELEGTIEVLEPDTIFVEEMEVERGTEAEFDLGYRIQVLASGELEKAEEIRDKVIAETAMAAYIEYVEGLYKVRAGDFHTREEAAAARAELVRLFPDCWIVSTTIRK